jgi:hypothetical protein
MWLGNTIASGKLADAPDNCRPWKLRESPTTSASPSSGPALGLADGSLMCSIQHEHSILLYQHLQFAGITNAL